MSNESAATTAQTPTQTVIETTTRHGKRRCRFIRTSGLQCGGVAMNGHYYCFHHTKNLHPVTGKVQNYILPFLDDTASIQYSVSRATQGLLDKTIEPLAVRTALYGASIANAVLRTELMQQRLRAETGQPAPEPISSWESVDGHLLAPDQEYRGPNNLFQPQWSFSKHMYESECERLGKPKPTCAADFPAHGWLTEEEMEEQKENATALCDRYEARIAELKKNRAAVEAAETAAGRPDPHPVSDDEDYGLFPAAQSAPCKPGVALSGKAPNAEGGVPCKPSVGLSEHEAPGDPAEAPEVNHLNAEPFPEESGLSSAVFTVVRSPNAKPGGCWCGGPDSTFPCHVCRAKKKEAEKAQNSTESAPTNPGLDLNAAADQAIPDRCPERCSSACGPCPAACQRGTRQNLLLQKRTKQKPAGNHPPGGAAVCQPASSFRLPASRLTRARLQHLLSVPQRGLGDRRA
jgi:hypothetical protein